MEQDYMIVALLFLLLAETDIGKRSLTMYWLFMIGAAANLLMFALRTLPHLWG